MKSIIWNLRSGISWWLLNRAFEIAPEPEKSSLGMLIQVHYKTGKRMGL